MRRLTVRRQPLIHDVMSHLPEVTRAPIPRWLLKVPGMARVAKRLGPLETRRRLVHMSPALLLVAIPFIPHGEIWWKVFDAGVVVATVGGVLLALMLKPVVCRSGERHWSHAVIGYVVPVILPLILFPRRAELGYMTLQIVALGDGSATLAGVFFGGRRLPWNPRKTIIGFLAFFFVGTITATYSYWGETFNWMPFATAFLICSVSALSAALVESLPLRSNDNLRVGMTAFLVGLAMTAVLA